MSTATRSRLPGAGRQTPSTLNHDTTVSAGGFDFTVVKGTVAQPKRGAKAATPVPPEFDKMFHELLRNNNTSDDYKVGPIVVTQDQANKWFNANNPSSFASKLAKAVTARVGKDDGYIKITRTSVPDPIDSTLDKSFSLEEDAKENNIRLEFSVRYRTEEEQTAYAKAAEERRAKAAAKANA